MIAFVGPDASGKSTLARDTVTWLGGDFRVRSAHLGKPPATSRVPLVSNATVGAVKRTGPSVTLVFPCSSAADPAAPRVSSLSAS